MYPEAVLMFTGIGVAVIAAILAGQIWIAVAMVLAADGLLWGDGFGPERHAKAIRWLLRRPSGGGR